MIMHTKTVKDIMTPLLEYKTISVDASMNEAAVALDDAQRRYEKNPREHRMLLITDADGTYPAEAVPALHSQTASCQTQTA